MGYSSGVACFPTQAEAAKDWCNHVEPGDLAISCTGCTGTSCTVSYLNGGGVSGSAYSTATKVVGIPLCEVPNPVGDAVLFSGAVISLWVAVAASMYLVKFFRVPHADTH